MPELPLAGHVALVTGAGRGIGRAHARLLAERGAKVVCCDRGVAIDGSGHDPSIAEAVASEIRRAGGEAVADENDVSTFAGGAAAVATGVEAFGFVDIVVNNAGTARSLGIDDVTEDALRQQFAVHLHGSLGTTRAAWSMMRDRGWGRVVNTVSEAAFPPRVTSERRAGLGYGPAKAAVWSATGLLAAEGLSHGITVNAVSPGAATRMSDSLLGSEPQELDLDPVHVARVVAWLVSPDAGDVTGEVIHVAGGQHRHYRVERHRSCELLTRIEAAVTAR